MFKSHPGVFPLFEKGDARRRKARVHEAADRYACDPGGDIRLPKQRRPALRAKVGPHCSPFGRSTNEHLIRSGNLDLFFTVVSPYTQNRACAALTLSQWQAITRIGSPDTSVRNDPQLHLAIFVILSSRALTRCVSAAVRVIGNLLRPAASRRSRVIATVAMRM